MNEDLALVLCGATLGAATDYYPEKGLFSRGNGQWLFADWDDEEIFRRMFARHETTAADRRVSWERECDAFLFGEIHPRFERAGAQTEAFLCRAVLAVLDCYYERCPEAAAATFGGDGPRLMRAITATLEGLEESAETRRLADEVAAAFDRRITD